MNTTLPASRPMGAMLVLFVMPTVSVHGQGRMQAQAVPGSAAARRAD
jgi:hypothetical protein